MPGIGLEIEGAIQQAPHPIRHFILIALQYAISSLRWLQADEYALQKQSNSLPSLVALFCLLLTNVPAQCVGYVRLTPIMHKLNAYLNALPSRLVPHLLPSSSYYLASTVLVRNLFLLGRHHRQIGRASCR